MNLFVVIPVYNRVFYTKNCLQQLAAQKCYLPFQVIVVDDGSTDGTEEMVSNEFPETLLVKGDGSWFWTGAVHYGIEKALSLCETCDADIVLINDDLKFSNFFIQSLLNEKGRHPNALIHSSTSYEDTPDKIRFGGVKMNWWTAKGHYCNRGADRSVFPKGFCHSSSLLWGQGLLIPVRVLEKIGNYDLRIQHRGDSEFSRRAALAGYDLLVSYDTIAYMYRDHDGELNKRRCYRLCDAWSYFFGVHSNARLKLLYWNARLMTKTPLQGVSFFLFKICRFIAVFVRNLQWGNQRKRIRGK